MYKYTKIQGPQFQRNYIIARYRKSDLHGTSFQLFVEEIKEVDLRSRRAQFIYDRNYNRNTGSPNAVLAKRKKLYVFTLY